MPRNDDDEFDNDRARRRPRDDDDARPRRRQRDDDDDFDSPPPRKKSNVGLIIGIIAGVLLLVCGGGILVVVLGFRSAISKVGGAAERLESNNNIKQISLAAMNYEMDKKDLPSNSYSPDGKPLLSWRVHLLPYVEEDNLYRQFKLDEPWDGPNNKKLLDRMPMVYATPPERKGRTPKGTQTYYRGFSNPGAIFEKRPPEKKLRLMNITDGSSNTILVVEAGDPVDWTKPDDLDLSPGKPLPPLGGIRPNEDFLLVGFLDGSVRAIKKSNTEANWRAATTYAGNDVTNLEPQ